MKKPRVIIRFNTGTRVHPPKKGKGSYIRKKKHNRCKSFTLIELLISIAIIFILVALLSTSITKAKEAGQRAVCLNDARVLNMMVEEGQPIIFGNNRDTRFIKKMRNYGDVIVVNCYNCHPNIIDFDRKEKLYP